MKLTRTIVISFFMIFGFNAHARVASEEPDLVQGAKREGRVVWYTVAGESQQLAQEFEKKYPFIKVEVVRSTVFPLLTRILNEVRAGNYLFDVVRQSTFTIGVLIQRGLIQPYESPERKGYNLGWKDKQGYWTSTDDNYFVIGYNTRLVAERDAPKGWEDLLLPKWRGQIVLDPDNHILLGGLEQSWGREKALAYFRKLAQQQVQFRKGNTLIAELVVAGEYPLGFVYAHRVEFLKSQKAPIEWISTMNPIVATGGPLGLAAKAQHPNSGKLLIDFLLSRDGQSQLRNLYRIPSRADLDAISPKLDPKRLQLLPLSPNLADKEDDWKKQFREIFGIQG
ncbi:MAG TPA: extracellular solute-binding protein [Candidatus Acidoferrales bacterium]|nr:extracellular solute-binding protein [Candidatus Acidoferrales bacterium]